DFDDLVVGAVAALEADPHLRLRWQARFSHLCVDEFQDVDAAQLRLVRILAAPEDNLFVVGDDDQP
ncbi:MAG: UvrD-helicase domain-containing protein, partial [Candidatus Limnocylindria bacterium]